MQKSVHPQEQAHLHAHLTIKSALQFQESYSHWYASKALRTTIDGSQNIMSYILMSVPLEPPNTRTST
jgi:hypothetical protein